MMTPISSNVPRKLTVLRTYLKIVKNGITKINDVLKESIVSNPLSFLESLSY